MNEKAITSCGIYSKTWAMIMAIANLGLGMSMIIGASVGLTYYVWIDFKLFGMIEIRCGYIIGVVNIAAGCLLITALIQGKEIFVFLYIRLEFFSIFILTVYSALITYTHPTVVICGLLASCPLLCIGLYNVYGFYLELYNYNNDVVQARVEEIACNTHTNPLIAFPEKAVDTTVV